jgi:hypothetical protein
MKIVAISAVKNEADFIECFIRINAHVIDEFFIADDHSDDGTLQILDSLKKENIRIHTFEIANPTLRLEQQQSTIVADLLHSALKSGFDFAFLLDADELILTPRKDVERELGSLKEHEYGVMPWKTFIPVKPGFPDINNPIRDTFSPLVEEVYTHVKAIVPGGLVNKSSVTPGNHLLAPVKNGPAIQHRVLGFPLCHFPVRSAEQIIAKALIMCHKVSMKRNRIAGEANQHFKIRDTLRKNNYTLSFSDVQNIAFNYVSIGEADLPFSLAFLDGYDGLSVPATQLGYTARMAPAVAKLDGFLEELVAEYRKLNSASSPTRHLV